jgi:U4/U6 small nuclear ribonucleoprotein PRP4
MSDADVGQRVDSRVHEVQHELLRKTVVVPTGDVDVKMFLRALGEPITIFGEESYERRDRLRSLLARMDETALEDLRQVMARSGSKELVLNERPEGLFFTEGPDELRSFRVKVARFSLGRARDRLEAERKLFAECKGAGIEEPVQSLNNQASEIADSRPVVSCSFSPNSEFIAVASWSGQAKIWNSNTLRLEAAFHAHDERLTSVVWHPRFNSPDLKSSSTVHLATGSADNKAKLWDTNGNLLRTLEGHTNRLARMAMHPMGEHLATASFDATWRLWDLETGKCILEQEGHSRAVYGMCFNSDGSLAVSSSLDGYARVWDLRTGRSLSVLKGHAKSVLAVDFSPNGHTIATGSADHTARVFDIRKHGESVAVLPGHANLISQVRFDDSGRALATTGYDHCCKLWCGMEFKPAKTLTGSSKIMGMDITTGAAGPKICTTEWNKTIKLWEPEQASLERMIEG